MDYVILKYMPLTTEYIESYLPNIYNTFIIYSMLFVVLLLDLTLRIAIKNLTFFKNREKLKLKKKENNQTLFFINAIELMFMFAFFILTLFYGINYFNESEKLKKIQSGQTIMGWQQVSLVEIKDKITIENNKLIIDKLPNNFDYKHDTIESNRKQVFEIERFSNTDKVLALIYTDPDIYDPVREYILTVNELKEIIENQENRKKEVNS